MDIAEGTPTPGGFGSKEGFPGHVPVEVQLRWLREFLRLTVPIGAVIGVLEMVVWWDTGRAEFVLLAAVSAVLTGVLGVTYRSLERWGARGSMVVVAAAIFAALPIAVVVYPEAHMAIALTPLIVIGLFLPHLRPTYLGRLALTAWALSTGVILHGLVRVGLPGTGADAAETALFGAISSLILGLVYLVVWQYGTKLNASLGELRGRNLDLVEAWRRLEALQRERTDFYNRAAHELATPLTPIQMQLHMLRDQKLGDLSERQRRATDILDRSLERLRRVVTDLLDIARAEAGAQRIAKAPMDLAGIARECVHLFAPAADQARVDLRVRSAEQVVVVADRARVGQILSNLIGNAIKFTPTGGEVDVDVVAQGGQVCVRVHDTGVGLTAEQIGTLFRPFAQAHEQPLHGPRGTGLGLYVCRTLAEAQGGSLACRSDGPGTGTTFELALPATGLTHTSAAALAVDVPAA